MDELTVEVQALIGPQYRVKVDDNVVDKSIKSRLIIVPGIFDHEKAVETIMKLEDRLYFFCDSEEEHQIPSFASLYNAIHKTKKINFKLAKEEILFTDSFNMDSEQEGMWIRIWNNLKYILNI